MHGSTEADLPPATGPHWKHYIYWMLNGLENRDGTTVLANGREIDPVQRGHMERRLELLRQYFDRQDTEAVVKAVTRLLAAYKSATAADHEQGVNVIAAYVSHLRDWPSWAVIAAIENWRKSAENTSAFAPSAAQIYEAARQVYEPYGREADELTRLLDAGTQLDASPERERVIAGFAKLRDEFAAALIDEAAKIVASHRDAINAGNAYFGQPDDGRTDLTFAQMCAERGIDPAAIKDRPS